MIGGTNNSPDRPTELYRREVLWAPLHPDSNGVREIEYTFDVTEWDRWVDDLPAHEAEPRITRTDLFTTPLDWSHNLAPSFLRVMARHNKGEST